jgi:hypothetical protein
VLCVSRSELPRPSRAEVSATPRTIECEFSECQIPALTSCRYLVFWDEFPGCVKRQHKQKWGVATAF